MFSRTKKLENTFGNQKLFSIFCYWKTENMVFLDNIIQLFSVIFLESFKKIIIQTYIMIKNKAIDIKLFLKYI